MSDELFPPETVAADSPRIAWMKRHGVLTWFDNGKRDGCQVCEPEVVRWVCALVAGAVGNQFLRRRDWPQRGQQDRPRRKRARGALQFPDVRRGPRKRTQTLERGNRMKNPIHMIGCNRRPGIRPGGMSTVFGSAKTNSYVRQRKRSSSREVKEAANAFLEKRGLQNAPNFQDSTVSGGYSR